MAPSVKQELLTELVTLQALLFESMYGARGTGAAALRAALEQINERIVSSVRSLARYIAVSGTCPRFYPGEYAVSLPDHPVVLRDTVAWRLNDIAELIDELVLQDTDEPEFDAMLTFVSQDVDYMLWVLVSESE